MGGRRLGAAAQLSAYQCMSVIAFALVVFSLWAHQCMRVVGNALVLSDSCAAA